MEACDMDKGTLDAMRELVARNLVQLCKDMGICHVYHWHENPSEWEVSFDDGSLNVYSLKPNN